MHCTKHSHEVARGACRRCAQEWCDACLVYAHGPGQPPFCVDCALFSAGVRTHGPPAASRRQLRARAKEAKRAAKQAAREARQAARSASAAAVPDAVAAADGVGAAAPDTIEQAHATMADWKTSWWEAAARERTAPVD